MGLVLTVLTVTVGYAEARRTGSVRSQDIDTT